MTGIAIRGIENILGSGRDDWQQDYCQHTETVSILTADIVRVFCKSCRYVSFHFLSGLSGEVARSRFARTSEHRGVIEHSKTS